MITEFQRRVYAMLCRVPRGSVTTYRALAAAVDCGSPRAVGQALRRNPFAPRVPCHRVVAADGRLGGFEGHARGHAVLRKQALLCGEGVRFCAPGRVAPEAIVDPAGLPEAADGGALQLSRAAG